MRRHARTALLTIALLPGAALGQTCLDTGDGSDGAFNPATSMALSAGTHQFSSINIPSGVTVTVTGTQELILKSQGAVTIDGILSVSGANGADGVTYSNGGGGGTGVAGGGNGGAGSFSASSGPLPGSDGAGPGGVGTMGGGWSGGGGAGYGAMGSSSGNSSGGFGGPAYGNASLSPFQGGSGGGGGSGGFDCGGGGGGAGAGAVAIAAGGTIAVGAAGAITANGGNGGSDDNGNCGGGGGGSGGAIWLSGPTLNIAGSVSATGGTGGASTVAGTPYFGTGAAGAVGRILFDAGSIVTTGSVAPAAATGDCVAAATPTPTESATATTTPSATTSATPTPTATTSSLPSGPVLDSGATGFGDTRASGSGTPGEDPNVAECIRICEVGGNDLDENCGGDDELLGTGGTDANGNFIDTDGMSGIALSRPLAAGDVICVVDVCPTPRDGNCVRIVGPTATPVLSAAGMAAAVGALLLVAGWRGRRHGGGPRLR